MGAFVKKNYPPLALRLFRRNSPLILRLKTPHALKKYIFLIASIGKVYLLSHSVIRCNLTANFAKHIAIEQLRMNLVVENERILPTSTPFFAIW